jgi:hypothetical protein
MREIKKEEIYLLLAKRWSFATPSIHKYFAFWVLSKLNFLNFDQISMKKYKYLQYKNYCIRIFSKHIFILCLFSIIDIDTFF